MDDLKRLCLQYIWGILDSVCVVPLLIQANEIGIEPKMVNLLLSYAAGHIGEVSQEDFNRLSMDLVLALLQCSSLSTRESALLSLVCAWAKHHVNLTVEEEAASIVQTYWRRHCKPAALPSTLNLALSLPLPDSPVDYVLDPPLWPIRPGLHLCEPSPPSEACLPPEGSPALDCVAAAGLSEALCSAMSTSLDGSPSPFAGSFRENTLHPCLSGFLR
eukprot:NODE_352_length_1861_cov_51.451987_g295_i0.p3 GENE.NODE_352_length_1861_cov_51.451987_g295_i0~~NODE_352_length_1861_cov_51.451987_g295_i0.p3  ORF type:complete len:217 (+),score=73.87 NODE_352_length_1861_cov_51.451987_g295_i0:231-881(+)